MISSLPTLRSSCLALLLGVLLSASLPAQEAAPVIRLEATPSQVDFGEAFEGEVLEQELSITNTGTEPWPLARIQTTCGCTVGKLFTSDGAELPTRPFGDDPIVVIEPGDSIGAKVEFRTAGKHGQVNQKMQVYHVDQGVPPLSLDVRVVVSRALQVNPRWVNLGNLSKSADADQVITVEALEIGEWSITGFSSQVEGQPLPDWLSFEVLDTEGSVRRVNVHVSGPLPVGPISPRVRIGIEHPRVEYVDFTMTGLVRANVTFDSGQANFAENINFEQFGPDEKVTRSLKITNSDPSEPYLLKDIEIQAKSSEFFEYEIITVQEGVSYEVRLTVDGAINLPFFRGNLLIKADHADLPTKLIPFHGWVRK